MLNLHRFSFWALTVCSPLGLAGVAGAQHEFGAGDVITTATVRAYSVYATDLDGDGDADVISDYDDGIVWYENLGAGTFGPEQVITTAEINTRSVYATDLDGDGDADVLSGSEMLIAWYENDGSGAFGAQQVISTLSPGEGMREVYAADLDGDGDADVLSATNISDEIAWYENLGAGVFGAKQVITTLADGAESVHAGDLDGDGDLDVLWTSSDLFMIAWNENLGGGVFGPYQPVWGANRAYSAYAADLDGDGDLDVLGAYTLSGVIGWFENLGGGLWGWEQLIVGYFPQTGSVDDPRSVYAADLDGDGDLDVLSASKGDDKIAWNENLGCGVFGSQQVITTASDVAFCVYATDLDGDGDADVLSASNEGTTWHENFGPGLFGGPEWINCGWCSGSYTTDAASSVFATDLDGDGDADVLSASFNDDHIGWYENLGCLGSGVSGPYHSFEARGITTAADHPYSVYATDLDGDGDADVLSASRFDNKIAWCENLGSGVFGLQQVITTAAQNATSVHATDLDGDGDADVLSASHDDDKIAWYENLGGGVFGLQQVITTAADGATTVYATDLDGDGDADVLSASRFDDKIAWYENLGNGAFGPQQVITTAADNANSVYAADLDGDGDADVLSASGNDDKIAWYENLGGGAFGTQQVISTAAHVATSVYATDLDGDGDADVLSASFLDDKIAWYENLGGGVFGTQQVITTNADGAVAVYATDLDGDGDVDVLSASFNGNKIECYENLLGPCVLGDDALEDNDACATTSAVTDGSYPGLFVSMSDPDYYSFTVGDGATLTVDVLFATANGDLNAMLYANGFCMDNQASGCGSTLACGLSASDDESFSWTNLTGTDVYCKLRVQVWPNSALECNTYELVLTGAGGGGPTLFCNPANAHSGGSSVTLGGSGFSGSGFYHLEAHHGPFNGFGYFLVSDHFFDPGVPISQGRLCLNSPIGRYNQVAGGPLNSIGKFDAGGVFQNLNGTSSVGSGFDVPNTLPNPPGGVLHTGTTWHFQMWYRDGAASNFSNGVSVTF